MKVLVGKEERIAVSAMARRTATSPSGSTTIETWTVEFGGQVHTFQCYGDRRAASINRGDSFGSVRVELDEIFVWKDGRE